MHILGISAYDHDSAAVLLSDGEITAAAQEERFTRVRHEEGFPRHAVRFCLETAGIRASDVELIAFHEKPLARFERLIETYLAFVPAGFGAFRSGLPRLVAKRLDLARALDRELGLKKKRYLFAEQHECHAAAAFFPSPFDEAAILTVDGVAEWATTTLGAGRGNKVRLTHEIRFPHSIGLLYSAFTEYLGFEGRDGEYEVMGLAAYGEPRHQSAIQEKLVDLRPDGSFRMDMSYFRFGRAAALTSRRFHDLFGGPPRAKHEPVTQRHKDLAASIQRATEEIVLRMARHLHGLVRSKNLVVSGSLATNGVLNGRIVRDGPFENVWVQPAPGNAGTALGVALLAHHQILDRAREPSAARRSGSLLGPRYSMERIERFLSDVGARYEVLDDATRDRRVSALIEAGKVVAWFQGRMEFGAHGLGARSLLGDPRRDDMHAVLNDRVKFRASFRPFAPSVLAERASEWFDVPAGFESPYMLVVSRVKDGHRASSDGNGRARAATIPAVTHVDGSTSPQTVDASQYPGIAGVLRAFERSTGCPVLVNTSFSVGSEPIVQSPEDAWRSFLSSEIDALVLENALVLKSEVRSELEARRVDVATGRERDPALEELLRCSACGGALVIEDQRAQCNACGHAFVREEGIWRFFHPTERFEGDVTKLVQSFYEEHPFPHYDEDESLRSLMEKARRGVYARQLGEQIPFGARVLEVGCGTGQLSNFLGLGGRTVVGADLCLNSLSLAEGFRAKHGLHRVRFLQMNLFRPAFAIGSFDVVLCNGVLLTTNDPHGGFESIARLVKPGGHIVIGLYNTWGRLAVDSRRVFFRATGGRMRWVDPMLRNTKMSPEKQDAWFHDQYRHPHETKQSMGEVLGWFERAGFEFVHSVPKTNPWEAYTADEKLFVPASAGNSLDRALAQAKLIVTGAREGGFFIMIARKKSA